MVGPTLFIRPSVIFIQPSVSGNFDRYSATRRTRRYKKNPEALLEKDKMDVSGNDGFEDPVMPKRPSTLALMDHLNDGGSELRSWQNKLNQQDEKGRKDIDLALAEIAKSGEDLLQLSQSRTRLPVSQPSPVIAVTNTVLSPVMQESRPRETPPVVSERAVTCRERHRSMIDPSQVQEAKRKNERPSQVWSFMVTLFPG